MIKRAVSHWNHALMTSIVAAVVVSWLLHPTTWAESNQSTADCPVSANKTWLNTNELTSEWQEYCRGWEVFKTLEVKEATGIARNAEPICVTVPLPKTITTLQEFQSHLRLVMVDPSRDLVEEIPVQVMIENEREESRVCEIIFIANVPANEVVHFMLFCSNPSAQALDYETDLLASGWKYVLQIENEFYHAILSKTNGNIKSMKMKKLPLSLYVVGAHSEDACIHWNPDILSKGQKFRTTNWPEPPNYLVQKGPVCIRIKRWGMPYSPVHPLYTLDNALVTLTYTFYSGVPYILMESKFDFLGPVKTVGITNDEWVFQEKPFTHGATKDRDGKEKVVSIQEKGQGGQVDPYCRWVSMYNTDTGAGFASVHVAYETVGIDVETVAGVGRTRYGSHYWCRYPVPYGRGSNSLHIEPGSLIYEKNAYLSYSHHQEDSVRILDTVYESLTNPLQVRDITGEKIPDFSNTKDVGQLRQNPSPKSVKDAEIERQVWEILKASGDGQFKHLNIVDLGLVYEVNVRNKEVDVWMTMPHRGRLQGELLTKPIEEKIGKLEGVTRAAVHCVWTPAWNPSRISSEGRKTLKERGLYNL